jgi:hypothetical protein
MELTQLIGSSRVCARFYFKLHSGEKSNVSISQTDEFSEPEERNAFLQYHGEDKLFNKNEITKHVHSTLNTFTSHFHD